MTHKHLLIIQYIYLFKFIKIMEEKMCKKYVYMKAMFVFCALNLFNINLIKAEEIITCQGFLVNPIGVKPSQSINIQFNLYELNFKPIWSDNRLVKVNSGIFNVTIGRDKKIVDHVYSGNYYIGISFKLEDKFHEIRQKIHPLDKNKTITFSLDPQVDDNSNEIPLYCRRKFLPRKPIRPVFLKFCKPYLRDDIITLASRSENSLITCLSSEPSFTVTPARDEQAKSYSSCTETCTIKQVSISKNFKEIVLFSPGSQDIWPGAIVRAQSVARGVPSEIQIEREPITVFVSGLMITDNYRTIDDPWSGSVESNLNDILISNYNEKIKTPAKIFVEIVEANSKEQVAMDLNLDKIFFDDMSAGFDFENLTESRSIFIKVLQQYYTVGVRKYSSGIRYIKSNVSCDDMFLEDGDAPVIITSVVYGRILIYQLTTQRTISTDKLTGSFQAVVFNGSGSEEQKKIFEKTQKRLLLLGGSSEVAVKIINSKDAGNFFREGIEWGLDSPGVPLVYRVNYMTPGLKHFKYGETTEFQIRDCKKMSGDNLWQIYSFHRDHGHENNFRLNRNGTPVCSNCWGNPRKISGSHGPGSLKVLFPKDHQIYGYSYFYVKGKAAVHLSNIPFRADVGRVWVNNVEITANPLQIHFIPGFNKIEFTCYNQNNRALLEIPYPLANSVYLMDSQGCN